MEISKKNYKSYTRFLIKTPVFNSGDSYVKKISKLTTRATQDKKIKNKLNSKHCKWYLLVSEKIIAISQGRSYFIKDIKPTKIATILSNNVTKSPYGIGLGSPWTMQLAIQEAGIFRILLASCVSFLLKPFGIKGVFYHVAGKSIASIDGPTEYSLYPSNVSAKLPPKDPQRVSSLISDALKNSSLNYKGCVIIDANDLGVNILGNDTDKPDVFFEKAMKDNPMGQEDQQTPLAILTSV